MNERPCRLVTLMELLQFYAHDFCELSEIIGIMRTLLYNGHNPSPEQTTSLSWAVKKAHEQCKRLELPTSADQCEIIHHFVLTSNSMLFHTFAGLLRELQSRMRSELGRRVFVTIPAAYNDYCNQPKPLFGLLVERMFPEMAEDIAESAKCLTLGRSTASVFHLMRVMEIAVQRFGDEVGVALVHEKVWQVILDGINKQIKAMDHKLGRTKALAEAACHLYNVKVAWRNEVMHPKQTYTDEEASKVFDNVETFVSALAALLPPGGLA